jgi:preprotein translocase SecE subunit
MAKQTAAPATTKANPIQRLREFFDDVKYEMTKVTWSTKEELKSSTSVVLVLLAILAAVIYFYDVVFQLVVLTILKYA